MSIITPTLDTVFCPKILSLSCPACPLSQPGSWCHLGTFTKTASLRCTGNPSKAMEEGVSCCINGNWWMLFCSWFPRLVLMMCLVKLVHRYWELHLESSSSSWCKWQLSIYRCDWKCGNVCLWKVPFAATNTCNSKCEEIDPCLVDEDVCFQSFTLPHWKGNL